jgi:hypothetical protein
LPVDNDTRPKKMKTKRKRIPMEKKLGRILKIGIETRSQGQGTGGVVDLIVAVRANRGGGGRETIEAVDVVKKN